MGVVRDAKVRPPGVVELLYLTCDVVLYRGVMGRREGVEREEGRRGEGGKGK